MVLCGIYNATPPAPSNGQALGFQMDSQGNLMVNVVAGGGGGGGNVNLTGINSVAPSVTNPLFVELSDGSAAFGTAGNPLSVNVLSGGGSNASVGLTGATAPTSATETGGIDSAGKLQSPAVNLLSRQPVDTDFALETMSMIHGHTTAGGGSYVDVKVNPSGSLSTQDGADGSTAAAVPSLAIQVGGSDGTNLRALATGTDGVLKENLAQVAGATVATAASGIQKVGLTDGSGTAITSTGAALDVNIKSGISNPLPISGTVTTNADTTIGGTVAPSKELLVAGKTNDGTPQYQPIPEGAGGRSVIVEGIGGGTAIPVTGTLTAVTSITNQVDENLKQVGGANVSTAASGVQKVGVVGNAGAAFDAPVTGTAPANAVYQGLRAATTYPTAGTDGQMVASMSDKAGRSVVVANAPRDLIGTAVVSNNSTASGVSFIGAGASGVFNDIITFIATNRSSTATVITLTDGTASYTFAIAGNGGIVINFPTPLPATSSATAWTIGNSATVACDYIAVYAKNK